MEAAGSSRDGRLRIDRVGMDMCADEGRRRGGPGGVWGKCEFLFVENKTRGAGLKGARHGRDAEDEDGEGLTFSFLERLAGGVKGAFIARTQVRPASASASCRDYYGCGDSRAQRSPR